MCSQLLQPLVHGPQSPPPEPSSTTHPRVEFHRLSRQLSSQDNQCVSQSQTILPFLNGNVNSTAYASVLDSCTSPKFGKQVHAHVLKYGYHRREFVGTKLLKMYGKFERCDDMALVFDKMPERNLYTYTAILNMLLDNEKFEEALIYFQRLLVEDIELEFFVFPVVLKICCGYGGVKLGRQLHGLAMKIGVSCHIYVGNALIDMYGKCESLNDAKKVLDNMSERDCISWNSMITASAANGMVFEALEYLEGMSREYNNLIPNLVSWSALIGGFAQNGFDKEAVEMMYGMIEAGCQPNARTLASVLPACARLGKLRLGKEIYGYIIRRGFMSSPYVVNGLIDLYRRCDDMVSSLKVFSRFSLRDEVSFNTMIAGYCTNGEILKGKELFDQMEREGKSKDLISWNSMISGYADNFMFDEALRLLIDLMNEGIEPDSFTLGSGLGACAEISFLRSGISIHSYCIVKGLESNLFVGGALVEMYCRCRDMVSAEKALRQVPERDIAIWNALISGYARCNMIERVQRVMQQMKDDGFEPNVYTWNGIMAGYVENGSHELALQLFSEMQALNMRPDTYTVGIVLPACSKLATTERGKQIHACAIRYGFDSDAHIVAALIDMYTKCGIMKYAILVYNQTKNHNLVTQNAILNAYAMHGHGKEGIAFFRKILVNGFRPDSVTFLAVLSSCVHAGSVETGQELFDLMGCYGVTPSIKHYTCMVDLLSRAGQLKRAYEVIEGMPVESDSVIWGALLGGCIIHGNVDLGEIAAHKLIDLEPENSGNYVMLANLYASKGKWHELRKIRQHMKDEHLHKNPGCSWIEDRDEMHVFMACDRSHKRIKEIYDVLDNLTAEMRLEQV